MKTIIVYYSLEENTDYIARAIEKQLDADLLRNFNLGENTCRDTFGEETILTEMCDIENGGNEHVIFI